MKLVSVRALSILLSLSLVIVTAAICLSLAITTGDEAQKKTEDTGNRGIAFAFDTAAVNVRSLSDSLMNEILGTAALYMDNFLTSQARVVRTNRDYWTEFANTPTLLGGMPTIEFFDFRNHWASRRFIGPVGIEHGQHRGGTHHGSHRYGRRCIGHTLLSRDDEMGGLVDEGLATGRRPVSDAHRHEHTHDGRHGGGGTEAYVQRVAAVGDGDGGGGQEVVGPVGIEHGQHRVGLT